MEAIETVHEGVALRIERHDGAFAFEDDAIPPEWTIEELTARTLSRLRYPASDITSGKPLRYSMLSDGAELPREAKVGDTFPSTGARVRVVREYVNA